MMKRALLLLLASLLSASGVEPALTREGWSFERSRLNWGSPEQEEEARQRGDFRNVGGWLEYDFEVAETGWYELWLRGMPPQWTRTIRLDGETILWHAVSEKEDGEDKRFKEANLWLPRGRHTLRVLRVTHPGTLPSGWELVPAGGRPEASIRATGVSHNVIRVGEPVPVTFTGGGSGKALRYNLVVRNEATGEVTDQPTLEFPAGDAPVEQTLSLIFPAEGYYTLLINLDGRLSRPADLKAGTFVAVDTRQTTAPATKLETRPVIEIDCTASDHHFIEKDGATRIVEKPFGRYRESSGLGRDGDGHWGLDGFSFRFDLPETQQLYRITVEYPDDERRTMGFWLNDNPPGGSGKDGTVNTGGVETGDQYPLTRTMQTHEAFFYPRGTKEVVVAVVNLVPGLKAAASRIRIDQVISGLPAASLGATRERRMGFYFEENGRWRKFFGGEKEGVAEDMKTFDRWGQWNRYLGANLMFPTINVYQGNHYPSRILEGYFSTPVHQVRIGALMAEKYGSAFVPEYHLSGQRWFDREIMGVWTEERFEDGKRRLETCFASPEAEELILRSNKGETKLSWSRFLYNPLHPRVQEMYLSVLGELADSLADCESFAGISSRMMLGWQFQGWNALPGIEWGYDDWSVARFESETGVRVPGRPGDPGRFGERYRYLTGPESERWNRWRSQSLFAYHQRLLARIREAKPTARLYFNWFGQSAAAVRSNDTLEQMRDVGMDPELYAREPGIVIIPAAGAYGRRFSTPVADARENDSSRDPSIHAIARLAGRGYGIYGSYFEVNRNLDWTKFGAAEGSAFDANLPSGLNERSLFSEALAEGDSAFISNGGSGWIFGTPGVITPFLREYRALPAVPFERRESDPVALWQHREKDGTLWFYLVNRLPVPVKATLEVKGGAVRSAVDDSPAPLKEGPLALEPFMLRAFRADAGAEIGTLGVEVPADYIDKLKPLVAAAAEIRQAVAERRLVPEATLPDREAALAALDAAIGAFGQKEWHAVRSQLGRTAAVQVYATSGIYPQGLFERSEPHGLLPLWREPAAPPEPALEEGRDRLDTVADLAFDAEGTLWVTSGETVLRLREDRWTPLPLFAPYEFDRGDIRRAVLTPPRRMEAGRLRPLPGGRLVIQAGTGAPVLYDGKTGAALASARQGFSLPGQPADLLATGPGGEIVIACRSGEGTGTYLYAEDGAMLRSLSPLAATGAAFDAKGGICLAFSGKLVSPSGTETAISVNLSRLAFSPDGTLLLALDEASGRIHAFDAGTGNGFTEAWQASFPVKASAFAFRPDGVLAVGFREPTEGIIARFYEIAGQGVMAGEGFMEALNEVETASLGGYTQIKARDDKLYFGAHGKLMRLTPGTPDRVEIAHDPGFRRDRPSFESFAFAPDGTLYLSSNWSGNPRGIHLFRCAPEGDGWAAPEPLNGGKPLYEGGHAVASDLETDAQGNLIVWLRSEKGGDHLAIHQFSPTDGKTRLLFDAGGSARGGYGLHRTAQGDLLIAGGASQKIARLDAGGNPRWITQRLKSAAPGYVDLRNPSGITMDGRGDLWVTDATRHQIMRFDGSGSMQQVFGAFGSEGPWRFDTPVGIATITDADGREWIYVADTGNRRLVKWRAPKR